MYTVIQDSGNVLRAVPNNRLSTFNEARLNRVIKTPSIAANKLISVNSKLLKGPRSKPEIYNIVNDYNWKVSPNFYAIEQPYIYLREYIVDKSTLLTQLLHNIQLIVQGAFSQFGLVNPISLMPEGMLNKIAEALGIDGEYTASEGQKFLDRVSRKINSTVGGIILDPIDTKGDENLLPFLKLYSVRPTHFEYKLPFFVEKTINKRRQWGKSFSGGDSSRTGAEGMAAIVQDQVRFVAENTGVPILSPLMDQGTYIERSKYFNPSRQSDPITFSFPLLNTLDERDIQKNFDFVWLMCFQSTAVRSNIADITPPCIYEVWIPGIKYMMFAAIEDIRVEYLGNRRRVEIIHPGSKARVETIIPEAYNLNFTITSLTTDSSNFMFKALEKVPA